MYKYNPGIYKIINNNNNKVYIGQATHSIKERWNHHKNDLIKKIHSNSYLQNTYNKYGDIFNKYEIIETFENVKDKKLLKTILDFWETYWIKYYNSTNNNFGYNVCHIGNSCLGIKRSKETKEKIKNRMLIYWSNEDNRKEKSKNMKQYYIDNPDKKLVGEKNGMYGKVHTKEWKEYLSKKNSGKNNPNYGNKWTEEQKIKLSNCKKGTEHTKQMKCVLQIDIKTNEIVKEFKSLKQAGNETKISIGNISSCCNDKLKSAGGYKWKYKK